MPLPSPDDSPDRLATLTHVRLRVAQGDLRTARRMLTEILDREPGRPEALRLLESISEAASTAARDPTPEAGAAEPTFVAEDDVPRPGGGPPRERRARLEAWLRRIRRAS
jgi:predicted RecB family endonuclease